MSEEQYNDEQTEVIPELSIKDVARKIEPGFDDIEDAEKKRDIIMQAEKLIRKAGSVEAAVAMDLSQPKA